MSPRAWLSTAVIALICLGLWYAALDLIGVF